MLTFLKVLDILDRLLTFLSLALKEYKERKYAKLQREAKEDPTKFLADGDADRVQHSDVSFDELLEKSRVSRDEKSSGKTE